MFTTKNLFAHAGKHLLIAFGFIVLTIIVVFYISGKITEVSKNAAKNRHTATVLSERTDLFSNLKRDTDIIGSNDAVLKQAFIPSNNILAFVSALENLALKNGLTQSFHFSSPTPSLSGGSFPTTTITYQNTISSNISTFINYLKDFEKLPYFTKIESLNITAGSKDWHTAATISFSASVAAQTVQ